MWENCFNTAPDEFKKKKKECCSDNAVCGCCKNCVFGRLTYCFHAVLWPRLVAGCKLDRRYRRLVYGERKTDGRFSDFYINRLGLVRCEALIRLEAFRESGPDGVTGSSLYQGSKVVTEPENQFVIA